MYGLVSGYHVHVQNPFTILIIIGNNPSITIEQYISLTICLYLQSRCNSVGISAGSVYLTNSTNNIIFKARIIGPTHIPNCADLKLYGSSSIVTGLADFTYLWEVFDDKTINPI